MCHVLVIEDEFLIADHIAEIVIENGATSVAYADTQDSAIREARDRLPALILSDVRLHEGTGPAAVETIRAEHGDIPVIFVTGTPEDCKPCHPAAVVLGKPLVVDEISHHFRRLAPI